MPPDLQATRQRQMLKILPPDPDRVVRIPPGTIRALTPLPFDPAKQEKKLMEI